MLDFSLLTTYLFRVFFGIPMGTNCVPLLSDLFLHVYDADFLPSFHYNKEYTFNTSFR